MNIRKVASLSLAVSLQVMPITRVFIATSPAAGSSYAIISTWIAGALALMGAVDAVSGASSISISPTTATVGTPYSGVVQYSGSHASSARSWQLRNNWNGAQTGCNSIYEIAPGLWLTNSATYLARVGGTPTASGTYSFTLRIYSGSNCGGGDNDTRTASITISGGSVTAPTITTQPASQTVTAGANVTFTVAASGTAPLSYQWRRNGANLSGAASPTLSLTSVTTNQSGSYTCLVTNNAGSATSTAATLTVNPVLAPTITTQPSSQTVTMGANVSFTVAASGTAPLSYQWRLNGANVSGATSATLSLTGVTTNQAGSYTCVVTNTAGSATSGAASLTVNVPPTITTQPAGQSVTAGDNVSFIIAASGTAPLSYQWRRNGVNLSGANSATLSLTSVSTNQAGSYTCLVTNVAGSSLSSAAVLAVSALPVAPSVTTQPVSQTVAVGANVTFTVAVSGTAPFSYQWQFNGGNISGATSATLNLTAVGTNQAGTYLCLVTNTAGSATSSQATLAVSLPPSITTQPVNQTVTAGGNVSFTVAAAGSGPLSYQWRLNGANISGATSPTLNLTGVTATQAGSYTCVVTNPVGSATSSAATLTVNAPPSITTQPLSQTVTAGANVTLSVAATGTAPLSFQWQRDGANIGGATGASLTLSSVTTNQSGSYLCVVTNVAGSATSSAATLAVNPAPIAPTITTQPVSQSVTAGSNVTFTVVVAGTSPFSFQWRRNGANIAGATSATLNLTGVTSAQAGNYTCVVTNAAGSATSSAAILTVNVPPSIVTPPASQTVLSGANVSLSVVVSGTAPLTYQWQRNGVNISGGNGATLTLTGVTTNQAGSYLCVVSNLVGTATSSAATLTVNLAPVAPLITTQPVGQTVTAGANVSLVVTASGTSPMSFQWRRNGVNVAGGTGATLNLSSVTTNQSGTYTCVASNVAGTATSSGAILTVQPVVPQSSVLTVVVEGQGTIAPDLNGATLTVGQSYTMTATAATGYTFAGWTGGFAGGQSASPTLTFVMSSNLVVQARFVASPFTAAAGVYNGLFFEDDEVLLRSAGAFNVRADSSGNYSGWLQMGFTRHAFSGRLDANLRATNVITRWNLTPLTFELRLGQDTEAGEAFGRVTDGTWTSTLAGGRCVGNSPFAGDYTVVIPGRVGDARVPAGDSYAMLHVGTDGLATMNGTLADGTQFAQSAYVTDGGDWPVYVSLYGAKGVVASWLHFADQSNSDLNGDVVWIKQAGASATSYPAGFTNETAAVGSRYLAPTVQGKALDLSSATVAFSGGTLTSAFNNTVSLNAGSQVVNLSPNQLTLTIAPVSGKFSGQVTEPGTGVSRSFSGVVLQKQKSGSGSTTGTAVSSRVVLGSP